MTGNSVEKCFAMWNVIQDVFMWLKPNVYCFCLERHGLFCLKFLHILAQQAHNLRTGNESQKPCIQLFAVVIRVYSFSEQVVAKENSLKATLHEKCHNTEFFSGPYFPVFGLYTENYLVNLFTQCYLINIASFLFVYH